ncbi:hypothetical protein [Mycolicibacterium sp.]|uniref:hypothetical protein n=1 Tax=Mycolicibacterium sp. TaxID=2320850 RepID=UPI001A1C287F|nr:hypothetical protein [Mycolicibacterium sp.]MBJ7400930.1 hypothetical protein [Mycolicibacterium sp.]
MSRATDHREGRSWPGFLFGGRVRTSTVVLLIAFFATWWLYDTYQPAPAPPEQIPATEVVPPGFIPDPSYTWVPRSDVQRPTPTTTTPTTTTPTTTTPTTTDTEAPTTTAGESPTPSGPDTPTSGPETTPTSSPLVPPPPTTLAPVSGPSPGSPTPAAPTR